MTRLVWIPTYPDAPGVPIYGAHAPSGVVHCLATELHEAAQFDTHEECQAWCDAHFVYELPWKPQLYTVQVLS